MADCLDRYYADLVPAEDVQRMRVKHSGRVCVCVCACHREAFFDWVSPAHNMPVSNCFDAAREPMFFLHIFFFK